MDYLEIAKVISTCSMSIQMESPIWQSSMSKKYSVSVKRLSVCSMIGARCWIGWQRLSVMLYNCGGKKSFSCKLKPQNKKLLLP